MSGYRVIEEEPGIAGYVIFALNEPQHRRTALNIMMNRPGRKEPVYVPVEEWPEGSKFYIPGLGHGCVLDPDERLPLVKIEQDSPQRVPARILQKPLPRRKSKHQVAPPRLVADNSSGRLIIW